ncbi:hypothetical protein D3C72_1893370 [compost metagenome]
MKVCFLVLRTIGFFVSEIVVLLLSNNNGSCISKVLPLPKVLSSCKVPPKIEIIFWQIDNPKPVPPYFFSIPSLA